MARLSPRQLSVLRAMWANITARGLAAKAAGRAVYRAGKGVVSDFETMRKNTFTGQVFNDVLERLKKNPQLQEAQAKIARSQNQAKAAMENTIDAVTDAATTGVRRASERVITAASRNPAVAIGTMVGATIAEGSMRAGKEIGKQFVETSINAPTVVGATQAYGAYRAVAGDKARRASRVIGRYLRGGEWEAGAPGEPAKFRKKLTLARLFGIKPRALPATGGTLSPKAVTEGVAGPPGRARKFMVEMGLGSQKPISEIDAEINLLHRKLRQPSRAIRSAREQLRKGIITQDQFTAVVKKNTIPKADVDALKARLQERLSLKRTGGYDVDRGHYVAVAGGLGYLAAKKGKERYETWQGGTEERAAQRKQEQLFNVYKRRFKEQNPKASDWDADNAARLEVAKTVRTLQLQQAMREASQIHEMMQGYPDPNSALMGYSAPPQSRRPRESRVSVRSRIRGRKR